jgi:predicted Zn-dependent peptidase
VGHPAAAVSDPPSRPGGGTIHLVTRPHSVQTRLMVGAPAIARTHPDFYALQVMNQVIGAGPTGRLFVHLREQKGYTYAAFSVLTTGAYRGTWSASTDVGTEVTGPALHELLAEVARLRDEAVPDEELRRQQRSMVASFALTLESPKQLLGYALTQWTYRLPADYWDHYPARIMGVTAADVQRVARKYLATDALHIVAVGDPPRIAADLAAFGPVEIYGTDGRTLRSDSSCPVCALPSREPVPSRHGRREGAAESDARAGRSAPPSSGIQQQAVSRVAARRRR